MMLLAQQVLVACADLALTLCHAPTTTAGPGPYFPKPREIYEVMEIATRPQAANILSAADGDYWRAVRQAAAPCFSMSNMKLVGVRLFVFVIIAFGQV
jgi:hypothetical protein